MTQYTFYFDSSACSGCKACQMACKDRHGLKVGLLWRRVYEVAGGGWTRRGEAWLSSVFAYHVSLACNHCQAPICAEVCPTRAITQRADGIVLLDPDRCVGCKYCSWACPYGAPQYDDEAGTMAKCTFCVEDLDAGLPPSCVAACPLRALDFGDRGDLEAKYGRTSVSPPTRRDVVFPLPEPSLTEPALVMTPHQEADRATGDGGHPAAGVRIGNLEEVNAR
jgi:anaerobic dimethyl sulfoxide reductase subunit B (iron-sulfur subunit)